MVLHIRPELVVYGKKQIYVTFIIFSHDTKRVLVSIEAPEPKVHTAMFDLPADS